MVPQFSGAYSPRSTGRLMGSLCLFTADVSVLKTQVVQGQAGPKHQQCGVTENLVWEEPIPEPKWWLSVCHCGSFRFSWFEGKPGKRAVAARAPRPLLWGTRGYGENGTRTGPCPRVAVPLHGRVCRLRVGLLCSPGLQRAFARVCVSTPVLQQL